MKRLVLLLIALSACPKPKADLGTPGISDKKEKCPVLPRGCPGGAEDNGCPDTMIPVGDSCAINAKGVADLSLAAQEMLNDRDVTRITIVAPTIICANITRAHFEAHGVPAWRLNVAEAENRTFISFQVWAWKEKACHDGSKFGPPPESTY